MAGSFLLAQAGDSEDDDIGFSNGLYMSGFETDIDSKLI